MSDAAIYQDYQGGYYMNMPEPESVYTQVSEPIDMGVIDKDGHLAMEDLYGVQTNTVVATIKGCLEEFADHPSKAVWTIPEGAHPYLQKVTSSVDRSRPTSENVVGNLNKTILLKAVVTEVRNTAPVDIGLDITGLVPTELTSVGRHNFVIFANTAPTPVNKNIFEPNSIFTKPDYIKYGKLTPEQLAKEITFPEHDPEFATVKIGGIASDLLFKNAGADKFDEELTEQLFNVSQQLPGNKLLRTIQIPVAVGRELFNAISEPLNDIDKAFVDLTKTKARFVRADGEPWNSYTSLVGEAVGLGSDDTEALASHNLVKEFQCSAKIELSYVCY